MQEQKERIKRELLKNHVYALRVCKSNVRNFSGSLKKLAQIVLI